LFVANRVLEERVVEIFLVNRLIKNLHQKEKSHGSRLNEQRGGGSQVALSEQHSKNRNKSYKKKKKEFADNWPEGRQASYQ